MTIKIYSKDNCINCLKTQAWLLSNDLEFDYINIEKDPVALEQVQKLQYSQLPVVYLNNQTHWSGHNVEKLEQYLK